jgi:zinc transport system ATP-binding protein
MTLDLPTIPVPPLVLGKGLTVVRGGKPILKNLDFELERGAITACVGLNGCGKSTLLRTILGEFPHTGELKFHCGHDHKRPQPAYVGYVPQRLQFDPRMPITVRDFLGFALQKRPVFLGVRVAALRRVLPFMERVGVHQLLDVPMEGLSGGQLQRILLSLALEPQPELLLLDEPASGVDFKDQRYFYELIQAINKDTGVTVVLVSHDLQMVSRIASYVICLRDGRVASAGPPLTVLSPSAVRGTFGHQMAAFFAPRPE